MPTSLSTTPMLTSLCSRLLLGLAARGELNTDEAESVAWAIHETNPAFVTEAIVNEFKSKLRRLAPPFGV